MPKILIIDDDRHICNTLVQRFSRMSLETDFELTLNRGLEGVFAREYDVVFLDVNLPDGNGLDAIDTIRDQPNPPEVIIMTGDGDIEGAELAIKSKAWDYIQKSGSYKEFKFSLAKALEYRNQKKKRIHNRGLRLESIVGQSSPIKTCIKSVAKASASEAPTLVTGETGTGKELISKAIHDNSHRGKNPFIVVDCAALPEHLVESVLFGHSKGAFTGADTDKIGLIHMADGGTLFLDEVGELSLNIQKKFLRALQEKKFRPVGGKSEISTDFRLITATHRDITAMVEEKKFREDFYYRISSIKIEIPPLRNRKSDIPLLTAYYLNRKDHRPDDQSHDMSGEFIEHLIGYDWPGNVRELFNTIDYARSEAFQDTILFPSHLPDDIRLFNIKKKIKSASPKQSKTEGIETVVPVEKMNLKDFINRMKHKYIRSLMTHTGGNIQTACELSGLSRGHLYSLLKEYNFDDA